MGDTEVLRLLPEDAAAAGESSVEVLAGKLAEQVDAELRAERRRLALQSSVLAVSLLATRPIRRGEKATNGRSRRLPPGSLDCHCAVTVCVTEW